MSHLKKHEGIIHYGLSIEGLPSLSRENMSYGYAARDLLEDVENAIKILESVKGELQELWNGTPPQKYY